MHAARGSTDINSIKTVIGGVAAMIDTDMGTVFLRKLPAQRIWFDDGGARAACVGRLDKQLADQPRTDNRDLVANGCCPCRKPCSARA